MAQSPFPKRSKRSAISRAAPPKLTGKQKLVHVMGWLLFLVAIMVFCIGIFGLVQLMRNASVATLDIVGTQNAQQQQQVLQQVKPAMVGNYFTSDLEHIRDHALRVSWVEHVVVSRAWPNQIRVRVIPKQAIARWGSGRLLSDQGDVFVSADMTVPQHLPLLHGPLAQTKLMMLRYNEINQLFAPLGLQLNALYLTGRMTWFMQFNTGVRVIVDQEQTMAKLQRLSHLAGTDLKAIWPQVAAADLRYRNGLALQWKNAQAPAIVNSKFVVNTVPASVVSTQANTP